jgi:5-methylcytosine-specific restriction endonuclease McrA
MIPLMATTRTGSANGTGGSKWIRPEKRRAIYESDGFRCVFCGRSLTDDRIESERERTLDHLIPRALGGSHGAHNLVTCCGHCNSSRQELSIRDWLRVLARLGQDSRAIGRRVKAAQKRHARLYPRDVARDY